MIGVTGRFVGCTVFRRPVSSVQTHWGWRQGDLSSARQGYRVTGHYGRTELIDYDYLPLILFRMRRAERFQGASSCDDL